jgi:twitching motility protein PilJ
MSLLDQLKDKFGHRADAPVDALADGADASPHHQDMDQLLSQIDQRLAAKQSSAAAVNWQTSESTDAADAEVSRLAPVSTFGEESTGLPLIGRRSAMEQQRVLGTLVVVGVLGFVVAGGLALTTANQRAAQLGATGQALMQSQRLAKSVSQALIGNPAAFPEVRESNTVLARNLRGLKVGNDQLSPTPAVTRDVLEPLLPLVDRAETVSYTHLRAHETM